MMSHTFAICAYKDSPYLDACIHSLKRQSVKSKIILCTSTPSPFLEAMAKIHDIPLYVRDGKSDIQDDCYHRDYAAWVQRCWERYPDTTVFTTDCAILKGEELQRPGMIQFIKMLLRLPLRLHGLADRTFVKKAALVFGNPIICPSCTYDKEALGTPLFDSPYKFALDWDTMWKLAARPGRFICVERPLIRYRIHDGATTKACIQDHRRGADETAMYEKIWPKPVVKVLMHFYRKAYAAYDNA